ncbi:formylglycine-generating enzyme family protein [Arthrobacter sp. TMN-49]
MAGDVSGLAALALMAIPAGNIALRDARTGSAREVALLPFALGRTQVTAAAWRSVMDDAGASPLPAGVPMHPVTWFDAVRWCNRASAVAGYAPVYSVYGREVNWDLGADGYRLPTEAEWEWAARAGTLTPTYGSLASIAWTATDEVQGPQPVAGKAANDFGLFDMIGNVWEWCWNYADTARYGEYRSLRGAGWDDPSWSARASVRRGSAPDAVLEDVGFRVARGAVGDAGGAAAQGWSAAADQLRAAIKGPLPVGWTPLRSLL